MAVAYTYEQNVMGGCHALGSMTLSIAPKAAGNLIAVMVTICDASALTSPDPTATFPGVASLNRVIITTGAAWVFWGVANTTSAETFTLSGLSTSSDYIVIAQEIAGTGATWTYDTSAAVAIPDTAAYSITLTPSVPGAGIAQFAAYSAGSTANPTGTFSGGFVWQGPNSFESISWTVSGHIYYDVGGGAISVTVPAGATTLTVADPYMNSNPKIPGYFAGALFYMTAPVLTSAPIRVYSQAVQRASSWMKRASGLWSPESGLIPRTV